MSRLTEKKFVLIKRQTRLESLIARYNSYQQVQFYIEHMGGDFSDYKAEDANYRAAVGAAVDDLSEIGLVQVVDREYLTNYIFGRDDIVVAVGQDGLVANTLKYLSGQPLIGVNPDPGRWDGILLPFTAAELPAVALEVLGGKRQIKEVTLAQARLSDGQVLYGVNDLFVGQKTHVSARYLIVSEGVCEQQSSSGVIVSTGLGSTGWLKSILTGASAISKASVKTNAAFSPVKLDWGADKLLFSVREPYPSRSTQSGIVSGMIDRGNQLKIISQMPENGVIFSDGIESDFLEFNAGMEAVIGIADKKGCLVI